MTSTNERSRNNYRNGDHSYHEDDVETGKHGDKGLGWFVTSLFLVGDLAGGGLVALPTAMIQSQFWTGITLSVLMTLAFMYTSCRLGNSWVMLQRRWPQYRTHCRKPYPEIGGRACGDRMKAFVSICIDIKQFGTTVVYLLLSAKNIHDALKALTSVDISFCLLLVVLALLLLPLTFLNSPQDFWGAAVVATCSTSSAVVLICLGAAWDYGTCAQYRAVPNFHVANYFLSLGTFLFAYGGHDAFPTVQHDMRRPCDFDKSSIAAFAILFAMYTPTCIIGYLTYGDSLRESVINSLQHVWIQQAVNILITVHLIFTILIVNNPLNQKMEELFNVPHKFGLKRVLVRTGIMAVVLFVAETVPTFGPLLDLIGGSVTMSTSLIFPCLFYLYLNAAELKANDGAASLEMSKKCRSNDNRELSMVTESTRIEDERASWKDVIERTDKFNLFCCCSIIAFGILGGAAATFSAIRELSYTHFVLPCYLSALYGEMAAPNAGGHINCCGPFQNVSIHASPAEHCSPPTLNFYN